MTREEKRELLEFLEELGLTREQIQKMINRTIERRIDSSYLEDTSSKLCYRFYFYYCSCDKYYMFNRIRIIWKLMFYLELLKE